MSGHRGSSTRIEARRSSLDAHSIAAFWHGKQAPCNTGCMTDIHPSHFAADPAFTTRFAPLSAVAAATAYTDGLAKPTPWTAVTFQNGWVNYGFGFQVAQYRKVGDMVQVRGFIKSGTGVTAAFTLPTGFRPPAAFYNATVSAGGLGGIKMLASGGFYIQIGSNAWFDCTCEFSVTA